MWWFVCVWYFELILIFWSSNLFQFIFSRKINRIVLSFGRACCCCIRFYFCSLSRENFIQFFKWWSGIVLVIQTMRMDEMCTISVTEAQHEKFIHLAETKNWWWFFNVWHAIAIEKTIGANELRSHHSQIHLPVNHRP